MITYGFWFYEELRAYVGGGRPDITLTISHGDVFDVRVNSTRLELLKQNPKCVSCNRTGELWMLQSHRGERPHLNLYAVNKLKRNSKSGFGNQIAMMTQDHILPKSKGGPNELWNLQTMCEFCNRRKADNVPTFGTGNNRGLDARSFRAERLRALSVYADYLAGIKVFTKEH